MKPAFLMNGLCCVAAFIILATGLLEPLFITLVAALLLFLLAAGGPLPAMLEHDRPVRLLFAVSVVAALAVFALPAPLNRFAPLAEGLRLFTVWLYGLLLLACLRAYPWTGAVIFRRYHHAALLVAGWGLGHYLFSGESRLTAAWANPSLTAAMLFPALLHTLLQRDRPWTRGRLGAALLLATALYCTHSRGVIAALLLALPALPWSERPAARRSLLAAAAGILLLVGAHLSGGLSRWSTGTGGDPQSFGRLAIWQATGSIIAASPWCGTGAGAFADAMPPHKFPSLRDPFLYGQIARNAHNLYLQVAAEYGLPALIALLYLLVLLLCRLPRAAAAPAGVRAAIIVWLLHAGVENLALFTPTLLLGISLAAFVLPHLLPPAARLLLPRPFPGVSLLAGGMLLLLALPPVVGQYRFGRGLEAEQQGDLAAALHHYTGAVTWSPLAGLFHMHRGGVFLQQAKTAPPETAALLFGECAREFAIALACEPRNPIYLAQYGRVWLLAGEPWRAQAALEQSLAGDPHEVTHWRRLATLRRQTGDLAGSIAALRRSVLHEPLYADGWYELAQYLPRPSYRELALAAHRYSTAYLRHLLRTDLTATGIHRYVLHLQEIPPDAYQALAGTGTAAAAGDTLNLWPDAE